MPIKRKPPSLFLKKSTLFAFFLLIILAGQILAISYLVLKKEDSKNQAADQGSQSDTNQGDASEELNLQELEWYMRTVNVKAANAKDDLLDASLYFELPAEWTITPAEDGNDTIYTIEDNLGNIEFQVETFAVYTEEAATQQLGNTGYEVINDEAYEITIDSVFYQVQYIRENSALGEYKYKLVYLEAGEEIGVETKTLGDYFIINPVGVTEYKATFQIILSFNETDQTADYLEVVDKIVNSMLVVIEEDEDDITSGTPIELEENSVSTETSYFGEVTADYCESYTLGLKITKAQDVSCRIYVQSLDKTGMLIVEYKGMRVVFSSLPVSDPDKKTWVDTPQYWTDAEKTALYESDDMFVNSYEESDGEGFVLNFGRVNNVRLYPYGQAVSEEEINISVTLDRNSVWYSDHDYDMNLTADEIEDLAEILDAVEIVDSIYD